MFIGIIVGIWLCRKQQSRPGMVRQPQQVTAATIALQNTEVQTSSSSALPPQSQYPQPTAPPHIYAPTAPPQTLSVANLPPNHLSAATAAALAAATAAAAAATTAAPRPTLPTAHQLLPTAPAARPQLFNPSRVVGNMLQSQVEDVVSSEGLPQVSDFASCESLDFSALGELFS